MEQEKQEKQETLILCLYLDTSEIIIGEIISNDVVVNVKNPYLLHINHENKLEFIPFLNEFSPDDVFPINPNKIITTVVPYDKYINKYIEICKLEKKVLV